MQYLHFSFVCLKQCNFQSILKQTKIPGCLHFSFTAFVFCALCIYLNTVFFLRKVATECKVYAICEHFWPPNLNSQKAPPLLETISEWKQPVKLDKTFPSTQILASVVLWRVSIPNLLSMALHIYALGLILSSSPHPKSVSAQFPL